MEINSRKNNKHMFIELNQHYTRGASEESRVNFFPSVVNFLYSPQKDFSLGFGLFVMELKNTDITR